MRFVQSFKRCSLVGFGVVILFSALSCSSSEENVPVATRAAIQGSVNLYDEGTVAVDRANMTVRVEGSNPTISSTTNAAGQFVLNDVPFGTYTLSFEKSGYGTYKKIGLVHQTNGEATVLTNTPSLGQLSTTTITDVAPTVTGNTVLLTITTNPGGNTSNRRYLRYFLSTNPGVSATNYSYYSPIYTAQINPFVKTLTQTDLQNAGFTSGQVVYVRVYGESFWDNAYDQPELNRRIFPNLNSTTVAASSFIVP